MSVRAGFPWWLLGPRERWNSRCSLYVPQLHRREFERNHTWDKTWLTGAPCGSVGTQISPGIHGLHALVGKPRRHGGQTSGDRSEGEGRSRRRLRLHAIHRVHGVCLCFEFWTLSEVLLTTPYSHDLLSPSPVPWLIQVSIARWQIATPGTLSGSIVILR